MHNSVKLFQPPVVIVDWLSASVNPPYQQLVVIDVAIHIATAVVMMS